jgi:hypothetical protein
LPVKTILRCPLCVPTTTSMHDRSCTWYWISIDFKYDLQAPTHNNEIGVESTWKRTK